MKRIVVDSSVVIKWFVAETLSAEARRILDTYQSGSVMLVAPDLLAAEIGNILWKKCRFQGLASADAQQVLASFHALTIDYTPSTILLGDAFRIALASGRTVYDSLYVALSEREQAPFVSADERLINSLASIYPQVIWVANWAV